MKKLLFALLLCSAFSPVLSQKINVYFPTDGSTEIESPKFVWDGITPEEGLTVNYDFYLGTNSTPLLFQDSLHDGFNLFSDDNTQLIASAASYEDENDTFFYYFDQRIHFERTTKYFWKVVAKVSNGTDISSNVFNFTTAAINNLPTKPDITYPQKNAQNVPSENLTIFWESSSDSDGDTVSYKVYLGTDSDNMYVEASGIIDTFYTIPYQLTDQQKYYLKVTAVDGYSGEEVENSYTPYVFTVENYLNDAPEKVKLQKPGNNDINTTLNVTLSWQESADKDGDDVYYDVYLDTKPNPTTLIVSETRSFSKLVKLTERHSRYYWKVVAKDKKGGISESPVYTFTPWQKPTELLELVKVEGGDFSMGQPNPNVGYEGYSNDEQPVHTVNIDAFRIGKYEVTWAQFCDFLNAVKNSIYIDYQEDYYPRCNIIKTSGSGYLGAGKVICLISETAETDFDAPKIYYANNTYHVKDGFWNYPAENVNPPGAKLFCQWAGGRLPTEAEWEYAARGGNKSKGYTYSGSNSIRNVGWYADNSLNLKNPMDDHHLSLYLSGHGTFEVGLKAPNEIGIYDMTGNVSELVSDWYQKNYYSVSPADNPQGPESMPEYDPSYIFRGGDWFSHDYEARNCDRVKLQYGDGYTMKFFLGFRFAADATENTLPEEASLIYPQNGSSEIDSTVLLKWQSFKDIEDDVVAYDVYVGTNANPGSVVASNVLDTTFQFTNLNSNTTYFWKIVAKDNQGNETESDNWSFSTTTLNTFTMDGTVLTKFGTPMPDVEMVGFDTPVTTNEQGQFSTEVVKGWTGKIRPFKLDYSFTPKSKEFTDIKVDTDTINFTGNHTYFYYIVVNVTDENGEYFIEPTIHANDGTIEPASNFFYMKRVNAGWTGVVTPELEGYVFSPESYQIDTLEEEVVINFSSSLAETYTISGNISDDSGNPLQGVQLSGFSQDITTNENGDYSVTKSSSWSGTITPTLEGYSFSPEEVTISALNSNTTQDFAATKIPKTYTVTFNITDGNTPITDASIVFEGTNYNSDNQGTVTFNELPNATYPYQISASGYESIDSNLTLCSDTTIAITMQLISGVNTLLPGDVRVYPNPVANQLTIEFNGSRDFDHILLIDNTGKAVAKESIDEKINVKIDMTKLPSGIYFLMVENKKTNSFLGKILKTD